MTTVNTSSAEAAYLTKSNIVHPRSEDKRGGTTGPAVVAADVLRARQEIADHLGGGLTITSGAIQTHR